MRAIKAYSKSSSFVVSFVFTSLLMLGVGFNTYTLSVANDELLIRETQAAIQADIGGFISLYNTAGRSAVSQAVQERVDNHTNDFLYYLKDSDNNYISGNLAQWPQKNIALIKNGLVEIKVSMREPIQTDKATGLDNQNPHRAIAMVLEFKNKDSLLVARSVQDIEFAVALAKISSWIMIIILCVVAAGSLGVAYYVVSRINKISDTADVIINTGDLSDRLHVDSSWDDLSKLTLVLNQLLEKIEQSVRAITLVSDNIAHDLRTPLTRLKGHIEELHNQDEKAPLLDECDNLMGIFNSLLRISDIENSVKKAGFKTIALTEVLDDAIDLYSPLLESKNITLSYEAENIDKVFADKDLVFQAFANVLDNAIKFTPENGKVSVSLTKNDNAAIFSIDDTGVGVSEESLAKLTRRFYREDSSRTTSGNGLGLSLVNAIVVLHDGTIWFEKSHLKPNTGLRCCMSFALS